MPSAESGRVTNAFHRFAKSADMSDIEEFSVPQIERALVEYSNRVDRTSPFYLAMQMRLEELKRSEHSTVASKRRWVDIAIGIAVGVVATLIANAVWRALVAE